MVSGGRMISDVSVVAASEEEEEDAGGEGVAAEISLSAQERTRAFKTGLVVDNPICLVRLLADFDGSLDVQS